MAGREQRSDYFTLAAMGLTTVASSFFMLTTPTYTVFGDVTTKTMSLIALAIGIVGTLISIYSLIRLGASRRVVAE